MILNDNGNGRSRLMCSRHGCPDDTARPGNLILLPAFAFFQLVPLDIDDGGARTIGNMFHRILRNCSPLQHFPTTSYGPKTRAVILVALFPIVVMDSIRSQPGKCRRRTLDGVTAAVGSGTSVILAVVQQRPAYRTCVDHARSFLVKSWTVFVAAGKMRIDVFLRFWRNGIFRARPCDVHR